MKGDCSSGLICRNLCGIASKRPDLRHGAEVSVLSKMRKFDGHVRSSSALPALYSSCMTRSELLVSSPPEFHANISGSEPCPKCDQVTVCCATSVGRWQRSNGVPLPSPGQPGGVIDTREVFSGRGEDSNIDPSQRTWRGVRCDAGWQVFRTVPWKTRVDRLS